MRPRQSIRVICWSLIIRAWQHNLQKSPIPALSEAHRVTREGCFSTFPSRLPGDDRLQGIQQPHAYQKLTVQHPCNDLSQKAWTRIVYWWPASNTAIDDY